MKHTHHTHHFSKAAHSLQSTQLVVVRHGETQWNVEGRMQGHLDSPLTMTGMAQARALAETLKDEYFQAIYSSDLKRAYQTAQAIGRYHTPEIQVVSNLRERNLGMYQGLTRTEIQKRFADKGEFRIDTPDYVIPEGETLLQFRQRCVNCFEELAMRHPNERILVVAHGGVLISLFKHTLNLPHDDSPRRFKILNTSVNVFSFENGHWFLETWGSVGHLRNLHARDED